VSRTAQADRSLLLITPEHVPLRFERADLGSRCGALLLDLVLQIALMLGLVLLLTLLSAGEEAFTALWLVGFFFVRNFYFVFQEIRWRGRTIGKRKVGLRVVAADGGPLTAGMVLARNLPRELEIYLPLMLLMAPEVFLSSLPGWARWGTVAWIALMALLPFLNRRRARLGDLVAGTMVVAEPQARLLDDLIEDSHEAARIVDVRFAPRHLAVYGVKELQVLEEVLRRPPSDARDELMEEVAERIRRKIGWRPPPGGTPHPALFLKAFYAAQRDELEKGMLFGRRREAKEETTG
jgi:uncharacterized RDD family membrane protein YckC